jgi:hypothetical protein
VSLTTRSDRLLGWCYRQVRSGNTRHEAFLEEALAAALEEPDYWRRLAQHLGWASMPLDPPAVTTQDIIDDGPTDIRHLQRCGRS